MKHIAVCAAVITAGILALAHSGGLDSKGGHTNRKTGEYHYHRQPSPGKPAPNSQIAHAPRSQTNSPVSSPPDATDAEFKRLKQNVEIASKQYAETSAELKTAWEEEFNTERKLFDASIELERQRIMAEPNESEREMELKNLRIKTFNGHADIDRRAATKRRELAEEDYKMALRHARSVAE